MYIHGDSPTGRYLYGICRLSGRGWTGAVAHTSDGREVWGFTTKMPYGETYGGETVVLILMEGNDIYVASRPGVNPEPKELLEKSLEEVVSALEKGMEFFCCHPLGRGCSVLLDWEEDREE